MKIGKLQRTVWWLGGDEPLWFIAKVLPPLVILGAILMVELFRR